MSADFAPLKRATQYFATGPDGKPAGQAFIAMALQATPWRKFYAQSVDKKMAEERAVAAQKLCESKA